MYQNRFYPILRSHGNNSYENTYTRFKSKASTWFLLAASHLLLLSTPSSPIVYIQRSSSPTVWCVDDMSDHVKGWIVIPTSWRACVLWNKQKTRRTCLVPSLQCILHDLLCTLENPNHLRYCPLRHLPAHTHARICTNDRKTQTRIDGGW